MRRRRPTCSSEHQGKSEERKKGKKKDEDSFIPHSAPLCQTRPSILNVLCPAVRQEVFADGWMGGWVERQGSKNPAPLFSRAEKKKIPRTESRWIYLPFCSLKLGQQTPPFKRNQSSLHPLLRPCVASSDSHTNFIRSYCTTTSSSFSSLPYFFFSFLASQLASRTTARDSRLVPGVVGV